MSRAISLQVRCRRGSLGTLSQHQARTTKDWSIVLCPLLLSLARFALVVVFFQARDCLRLLGHIIDHEWLLSISTESALFPNLTYHGEIVEAVSPGQLHDGRYRDQLVAGVQHPNVALATSNVDKLDVLGYYLQHRRCSTSMTYITKQFLDSFLSTRRRGRCDGVLEQLVLLG